MRIVIISLLILLGIISPSYANDSMSLSIGKWSLEQLYAENLNVSFQLKSNSVQLQATATSFQLPEPIGRVDNAKLICNELYFSGHILACQQGQLLFKHALLGEQNLSFTVIFSDNSSDIRIHVSGLVIGTGNIDVELVQKDNRWAADINGSAISLAELKQFVSPFIPEPNLTMLSQWKMAGLVTFSASIEGHHKNVDTAFIKLSAHNLNITDLTSQYVTEQLGLTAEIELSKKENDWFWSVTSEAAQGQGYFEPIFIDFEQSNIAVKSNGVWLNSTQLLHVNTIVVQQADELTVEGSLTSDLRSITSADMTVDMIDLTSLYETWMQPFLTKTVLNDLSLKGSARLGIQLEDNFEKVTLALTDVYAQDNLQRFSIDNISGVMAWTGKNESLASSLQWERGQVYSIPFGQSTLKGSSSNATFSLDKEWVLPILDGGIQMNHFKIHRTALNEIEWSFSGVVSPISMSLLSEALAWPKLSGKLSGMIPNVSYKNKAIAIDGALMVRLFDGTTIIRNMQLSQPFGVLPTLSADIDLTGLDLETLTSEFDFGKITGKLNGKIQNLRLVNWLPVAFDAQFMTPENDQSKHRISQRAVDNLSELGGGASGMFSRSFLGFFEDFSYQKIGVNCRLVNEVCFMSGIEQTDQGYYIVKGGGLPPRINVMGYTERVDWSELITRLKAVSQSEGPVIQ